MKDDKYHDPFGNPIYVYMRVGDKTVTIKADDLQKALDYVTEHGEEVTIEGRSDNNDLKHAPTIEPRCEECEAFNKTRLLIPQPERKVGTWEQVEEIPSIRKRFKRYCCSNCKKEGFDTWNYCPECGQKNRKGEQE